MKVIKRGQLAILSLTLMVMIAGYINYKYDGKREENLGKTVRVNSDETYLYNSSSSNVDIYGDQASTSLNQNLYNKKSSETLATFKSNRDDMFSELESTYMSAINNTSASKENIKLYQEKLDALVEKKHIITIVENLIKTKGITDIVIVPTDDKYTVIVSSKEKLTDTQVALIEQIMKDELKVDADKITITQD